MKIRHGIKYTYRDIMMRQGTTWMNRNGKGELGLCSYMIGYVNNVLSDDIRQQRTT